MPTSLGQQKKPAIAGNLETERCILQYIYTAINPLSVQEFYGYLSLHHQIQLPHPSECRQTF